MNKYRPQSDMWQPLQRDGFKMNQRWDKWIFTIALIVMVCAVICSRKYDLKVEANNGIAQEQLSPINKVNTKQFRFNPVDKGLFKPETDISGVYEHSIKERFITRVSSQAPNYKISNKGKYISFLYNGGTLPAQLCSTRNHGWRWKYNRYGIDIEVSEGKVKETIKLNRGAPVSYYWVIDSNEPKNLTGYGDFVIPHIKAWDGNGDSIIVNEMYFWDKGWVFKITIDTAGKVFPIIIDPTVIIKPSETFMKDAYYNWSHSTDVKGIQNDNELILNNNYVDARAIFLQFPILDSIPKNSTIISVICSLYVWARTGSPPTTGYFMCKIDSQWDESTARWKLDTVKTDVAMAMDTSISHWFVFSSDSPATTNGIAADSLLNWTQRWVNLADSNFGYCIRYTNENAASANMVRMHSSANGTASLNPSLTVNYVTVRCSTNQSARTDTSLQISVLGADTSSFDSVFVYNMRDSSKIDCTHILNKFTNQKFADTLTPNTQYILRVKVSPYTTYYSVNSDTAVTLAKIPPTVIVDSVGIQLRIKLFRGKNPSNTKLALYDSTVRRYISAAGDTTPNAFAQDSISWGASINVSYIKQGQWYKYTTKAINSANETTAFGGLDSSKTTVKFDSVRAYAIDTVTIQTKANLDTFTYGKYYVIFAYDQYKITDTLWSDTLWHTSSAFYNLHTDTIILRDSLNHKWYIKGKIVDSANTVNYSLLDSVRTKAWQPSSVSFSWLTDSTGTLIVTRYTPMPLNSGYFAWDSVRVSAGSTKVYINPDSVGFSATRLYKSATGLSKAINFGYQALIPGSTIKIRVHGATVDSLGNQ